MATVVKSCDICLQFDNTNKPSELEGDPFRMNKYMSGGRFEK